MYRTFVKENTEETVIPVLTYHSIDDEPLSGYPEWKGIFVKEEEFDKQVRHLKESGYGTITLSNLRRWMEGEKTFDFKPLLITFDDGYRSALKAEAIMKRYDFKGNVFIITDYIGKKSNGFCRRESPPAVVPMLSWGDIDTLAAAGWEFGAHTMSHDLLDRIEPSRVEEEMLTSKHLLEDKMGAAVDVFAYPNGKIGIGINAEVYRIAGAYFKVSLSTETGFVRKKSVRHLLPRITVNGRVDLDGFKQRLEQAYLVDNGILPDDRFIEKYNFASELERRGLLEDARSIFYGLLLKMPSAHATRTMRVPDIFAGIFFHLGRIHFSRMEHERAAFFLLKAVALIPGHIEARKLLERVQ